MTKVRALQDYPFADKQRHAGDVFDASDEDANTLVLTGLAVYAEKPGSYQTRQVKADDAPSPPTPTAHSKREYRRRDMLSER